MRDDITLSQLVARLSDPNGTLSIGASAALAGSIAAAMLAEVCGDAMESSRSDKAAEELSRIRDRARSLRRDLLALVDHGAHAEQAVETIRRAQVGVTPGAASGAADAHRLRALLFASEVPLRTAESCHALLNLALKTLGRAGIRSISQVGTSAALAFSGVVGGILAARTFLAGIPSGSGIGAEATRRRAERIFREAEAIRTQIIDRVRQHLP